MPLQKHRGASLGFALTPGGGRAERGQAPTRFHLSLKLHTFNERGIPEKRSQRRDPREGIPMSVCLSPGMGRGLGAGERGAQPQSDAAGEGKTAFLASCVGAAVSGPGWHARQHS